MREELLRKFFVLFFEPSDFRLLKSYSCLVQSCDMGIRLEVGKAVRLLQQSKLEI